MCTDVAKVIINWLIHKTWCIYFKRTHQSSTSATLCNSPRLSIGEKEQKEKKEQLNKNKILLPETAILWADYYFNCYLIFAYIFSTHTMHCSPLHLPDNKCTHMYLHKNELIYALTHTFVKAFKPSRYACLNAQGKYVHNLSLYDLFKA